MHVASFRCCKEYADRWNNVELKMHAACIVEYKELMIKMDKFGMMITIYNFEPFRTKFNKTGRQLKIPMHISLQTKLNWC